MTIIPGGALNFVLWGWSYSIKWEKLVNSFFTLERLPFFKNLCFHTTWLVLQNWFYNLHSNCQSTHWTLANCPLRFVTLDNTRKNGPKPFVIGKTAFFSKSLVIETLGSKKRSYSLQNTWQNTLCAPMGCSLTFVIVDNTRKNGPKIFSLERLPSFQKFVFPITL